MCWRNFDFYYKDLIYKVIMNYIRIKIKFNKIITYQKILKNTIFILILKRKHHRNTMIEMLKAK